MSEKSDVAVKTNGKDSVAEAKADAKSGAAESVVTAPKAVVRMPARLLDSVQWSHFGSHSASSESKSTGSDGKQLPLLMVVGGVHGNETRAIEGAELLVDYLRGAARHELARLILERALVHVCPAINRVGQLAGARACPLAAEDVHVDVDINVAQGSSGCRVIVPEDEKHSIKVPPGWADPNRGWADNDTLVRHHLAEALLGEGRRKPEMIVFTHDWAAPQGKVKLYAPAENAQLVACATKLYARFYPARTPFGKPWQFVEMSDEKEDTGNMSWPVWKELGVPNYVLEAYVHSPLSATLHFAVCLLLLAKHARVQRSDEQLLELVAAAVGSFGKLPEHAASLRS